MHAKKGGISAITIVAVLGILGLVAVNLYKSPKKHTVILVAGTSSAGKTSIIEALKKMIDSYQVVSIDAFDAEGNIKKVLEQKARAWGWDDKKSTLDDFLDSYVLNKTGSYMGMETVLSAGPARNIHMAITNATYQAFFEYAYEKAFQGNIIIDTVFDSLQAYEQFISTFKNHKTYKVLVYCPLNVIEERVEKRNKTGKPGEQRNVIQAFTQFAAIYKVQQLATDQIIDTVQSDVIVKSLERAVAALIQEFKQAEATSDVLKAKVQAAIESVYKFKEEFIKQFKLVEYKEINIASLQHYDLILNSETSNPDSNAQKIVDLLNN